MSKGQSMHRVGYWMRCVYGVWLWLVGSALALPAAALPLPDQGAPLLRIHGSNTIGAKLAPALIAGLLEAQGYRTISIVPGPVENEQMIRARTAQGQTLEATVAAHGSGTGFVALQAGQADLAASSRPIRPAERQALAAPGVSDTPYTEHVIAIDGLAIIVHPDNRIRALNVGQLAALFAGEIDNWSKLGGADLPVHLHARDEHSGTFDTFKELVLASGGKPLAASAKRYESSDRLAEAVSEDAGAIGFVGLASIGKARPVAIADGDSQPMLPESALIATEDYPLSRRLYLYAPARASSPWTEAFLEYAQSDAGQALVAKAGYIPQAIQAIKVDATADLPPAYRQLAREAARLTVNFRFADGSAQLDGKALRDIKRVADYLRQQNKLAGKTVLVGFGDAKSVPARAELLSRLRAMAVRRELLKEGVFFKEISGMGDNLPVASNMETNGRNKNRRVEVWVY